MSPPETTVRATRSPTEPRTWTSPGLVHSCLASAGQCLRLTPARLTRLSGGRPGQRTDNGGGSTGGGVSAKFPRPAWQGVKVTSLNRGGIDGRVVPDVAALAGQPLYDLIFAGKAHPNGGTSASAPLWASLVARVDASLPANKRQRFLTPLLYRKVGDTTVGAQASRDIVDGNNASFPDPGRGYVAAPGFDAVTGWGVPGRQGPPSRLDHGVTSEGG